VTICLALIAQNERRAEQRPMMDDSPLGHKPKRQEANIIAQPYRDLVAG